MLADIIYFVVVVGVVQRVEKWHNLRLCPKKRRGKPVDIYAISLNEMCKDHIQHLILLLTPNSCRKKGNGLEKEREFSAKEGAFKKKLSTVLTGVWIALPKPEKVGDRKIL